MIKLALLGFGNVHRAFAQLLIDKTDEIQERYDTTFQVVGIATGSHGIVANPAGINLGNALQTDDLHDLGVPMNNPLEFVTDCPADILLEATPVDPTNGQPAIDYIKAALQCGKHVITANKGPVAFAHRELTKMAGMNGLAFFYEATVIDGVPVHSLAREGLPALKVMRVRGVLNSTTNGILTRMEEGVSFNNALKEMQTLGLAETDPSNDIDGWDSALKICVLANTLMDGRLTPQDVDPVGIRDITHEDVQLAVEDGTTLKLVCEAFYDEEGKLRATVLPTPLEPDDPLAWLDGTAGGVTIYTDVLEEITIREGQADPRATAYGMLADAINIARGRR